MSEICAECGMPCSVGDYHPYAACLMFKSCGDSETVKANLKAVRNDDEDKAVLKSQLSGALGRIRDADSICLERASIISDKNEKIYQLEQRNAALLTAAKLAHGRLVASGGDAISINALNKAIEGCKV